MSCSHSKNQRPGPAVTLAPAGEMSVGAATCSKGPRVNDPQAFIADNSIIDSLG